MENRNENLVLGAPAPTEDALKELEQLFWGGDEVPAAGGKWDVKEMGRYLNEFVSTLKRKERILWIRRYYLGSSIEELARESGTDEEEVKQQLSQLRNQWKLCLVKEGCYQ